MVDWSGGMIGGRGGVGHGVVDTGVANVDTVAHLHRIMSYCHNTVMIITWSALTATTRLPASSQHTDMTGAAGTCTGDTRAMPMISTVSSHSLLKKHASNFNNDIWQ